MIKFIFKYTEYLYVRRDAGTRKGPGGADFVEEHRQNFNYVKIHTLEFRESVAFFLCQILTDHILKAVFQLRVFHTYVHARKTLNPFQCYI